MYIGDGSKELINQRNYKLCHLAGLQLQDLTVVLGLNACEVIHRIQQTCPPAMSLRLVLSTMKQ